MRWEELSVPEVEALDRLARLPGTAVKISYDVRRTRLHAKAWLFRRDTGLSTAYVGSANLTATALGGGHHRGRRSGRGHRARPAVPGLLGAPRSPCPADRGALGRRP